MKNIWSSLCVVSGQDRQNSLSQAPANFRVGSSSRCVDQENARKIRCFQIQANSAKVSFAPRLLPYFTLSLDFGFLITSFESLRWLEVIPDFWYTENIIALQAVKIAVPGANTISCPLSKQLINRFDVLLSKYSLKYSLVVYSLIEILF